MSKLKNKIIRWLGGHTDAEYQRLDNKYQSALSNNIDKNTVQICNQYIYRTLEALDAFAQEKLYGIPSAEWAQEMYNVIHNNKMKVFIYHVQNFDNDSSIYKVNTSLSTKEKILEEHHDFLKQQ